MEFNLLLRRKQYLLLSVCSVMAFAVAPPLRAAIGDEQFIRQQQRQQALEEQLIPPVPDVRLSAPAPDAMQIVFPAESPCFTIHHVMLEGQQALPHWLPLQKLADRAVGKCLGARGINLLMSSLQNRMMSHGWTTTRVLAPAQDLKSGRLRLTILPGKIRHVAMTPDSSRRFWLYSAFPAHDGDLLDLRDIEQGLENLQRLPTVQAEMEIVPADQPGESDIMISRRQRKFWRLGMSLDDSGTTATGRYQGGLTLSLDNPLALSDLFWVSLSHDLQPGHEKSNQNLSTYWSVPVGWWSFSLTGSDYHYHQTVAGLTEDYRYGGKSQSLSAQLSRMLYRNDAQKTTLTYEVQTRTTRNYINDTEIEVQRRHVSSWKAGLQHHHYIGPATLDAGISYQSGTRWFGAQPAPEEPFGEGTALSRILRTEARLSLPFVLAGEGFRYDVAWQRQTSNTPLTPQDRFSVGGRWTVRGFDGERTLSADRGWTVRNDLSWRLPLSDTSLFKTHPQPEASYLVETDPRFTNNKQWLGSDYMQNAFSLNGDNMHKRLGDGYYEQRLVREQIIALTGCRYLADYRDDEAQFKGLMNAGIAFGKEHNLILGVALTAEQMSLLTEDMAWLVNADVVLPDGTRQTVLVPQVYVRVKEGDIDGSGALLGGRQVAMNLSGDLLNSGAINGRETVQLSAENITNKAGAINGADVSLLARTDINNIAGMITGNDSVLASAGRDINIVTTTRSAQSATGQNSFARTTLDRVAGIYVQGEEGKLSLSAGRDITLTGGQVVNSGSLSQTVLNAGRDLNLNAVATAVSDNLTWDKDNWLKQSATQHVGSEIAGTGSVLLVAGRDVSAQAAMVSAGGSLGVGAGRDITLTAATDSSNFASHHKSTGGNGAFSKNTVTTHDVVNRETAQGSAFSGASVTMQADNNLLIQGSSVAGDDDVRLAAGHNLAVTTADEYSEESHQHQEKKSGLSGTGGLGLTWGNQKLKVTDTAQDVTQQGSTVGSVNGNVSLTAGNELTVKGSNLVAGRDMALSGKQVNILAAENQSSRTHSVEQKSSGLTLALSGAAGSAINQAVTMNREAKNEDNDRIAALQGVKAVLSGVQAGQAVAMNAAQGSNPDNNNAIGVTLSWGSQSSKSEQTQRQSISQGSSAMAGNNLTIRATDGDITVRGSELQAGNNALLAASRDINMISGENTSSLSGKNESKGGTVGVGIGAGSGGWGLQVSASVNKAGGKESGNGTTHTESTLTAGNHVTLKSGRDAMLTGAQVSGEKITADVGRNLTLTSEQDTDKYDSKQQSAGAGGTFSIGSMSGSGSLSLSKDRMHSTYASVQEQTGLFAGSGGFDVTVGGHTQLDGAVIASTATAENNRLDTGMLGWRDTGNRADYKTEHQGAGISSGGSIGSEFAGNMANALLTGANGSGSASSTTRAAVSGGNIVIRDTTSQQQDVANLSRDTAHAHGALSPVFDREKEQTRLREAQLIGEIGNQVADIARTEGQIIATQKAQEKMSGATQDDRDKALAALKAKDPTKSYSDDDITNEVYSNFYNQAYRESGFGTGGQVQQAIQAATAAVQGLAGGDIAKAIAGGSAPYLAEVIHNMTMDASGRVNTEANLMAHAVLGAVVAQVNGNSALAGAAGATTGEFIAQQLWPGVPREQLSEEQRQTISALGTLAAGLAGGVAGDSTGNAVAGAQAGKNAVENNALGAAAGAGLGFWLGKTPDATAEDKAKMAGDIAKGNAIVSAELAGSVGLGVLPKGAQITAVIGGGANTIIQYVVNGEVNYTDALIASWVGAATSNTGLLGTVGWNAAGGATSNYIKGNDPLSGAIISGGPAGIGYGLGQAVKGPLDKVINPNWKNWEWVDVGMGVSKPMPLDPRPAVIGNIISSGSTEGIGQGGPKAVSSSKEGEK